MSFGPTVGINGFGSGLTTRYESANAVCRGGSAFTVLVALQTRIPYSAARQIIAGNYTGGSGWYLERTVDVGGGVQYVFNISVGPTQLAVEIPFSSAFGRTLLLGLTVNDNGFVAAAYANGAQVSFASYGAAFVPGQSVLRIGGDGLTLGPQDRIISLGYTNSALTAEQMALVFDDFRNTSLRTAAAEVLGLPLLYSYEASDISVPPQSAPPATWPNGGSAGLAPLSWQGPTTNIPDLFTTDRNPDFGGAASQGSGGGNIITEATTYYLDAINGDDTRDGLTPATSIQTWTRAFELAPRTLAAPLIFQLLTAGDYGWFQPPQFLQLTQDALVMIYGAPTSEIEIATIAASAGTDANQITVAGPLVVDEYQHFSMEMLDGPAAGYRRTVQRNTATSIIPCRRFETLANVDVTPVAGNTVRIFRPGAIIRSIATQGSTFFANIGKGDSTAPLVLMNVALDDIEQIKISDCSVYMAGVEMYGTTGMHFEHCGGSLGWWDNYAETLFGQAEVLPRNTEARTVKAGWLAYLGLASDVEALARQGGWGVSCPDVVTQSALTGVSMFVDCHMSAMGTWGGFTIEGGYLLCGGYFWGVFSAFAGNLVFVGRGNYVQNVAGSCVFRRSMVLEQGATAFTACPFEQNSDTILLQMTNAGFTNRGPSGSYTSTFLTVYLLIINNSYLSLGWNNVVTISGSAGNNNNAAMLYASRNSSLYMYNVTATNGSTGRVYRLDSGATILAQLNNLTGTGGVLIEGGASGSVGGTITGPLIIDNADFNQTLGGNLVVNATSLDAITVRNGGNFVQGTTIAVRTLNATAITSGRGMFVTTNSQASLRGGANTTITGVSLGLLVNGGSSAWFTGGDPTGVSAPGATNDLQTGILASVENSAVAGVGSAIGDAYGNVIGRAA